jgi:hypothetical protein
MSKEGSTYTTPIKFRNANAIIISEKGKKAYENQVPGTWVYASDGRTYKCHTSKSKSGAPIWHHIDDTTKKPLARYVLAKVGGGSESLIPEIKTSGGRKITLTQAYLKKYYSGEGRWGGYSKSAIGEYVFLRVPVDTETDDSDSTTTAPVTVAAPTVVVTTPAGQTAAAATTNADTNGRSGSGNTGSANGSDGTLTPAQIEANRRAAWQEAWQAAREPTPAQKAAAAAAATAATKKAAAAAAAAKLKGSGYNNPTVSTVAVTFAPDRIITIPGAKNYIDNPHIQQTITTFDPVTNTRQKITRRHVFNIVPNSFEFSQLSSTWNEVERSANFPMVDWSKYNLTKCSFRFLVASKRTDVLTVNSVAQNTIVNDGMDISVDAELENIRAIAGAPYPVTFYNLNRLISTSYRFPYLENTRGIQWVIADLSITASRLTPGGRGIAAAEVSITLNEYPVIARNIVALPPLLPTTDTPKQCKPKPCPPPTPSARGLWTDSNATTSSYDSTATPEAKTTPTTT